MAEKMIGRSFVAASAVVAVLGGCASSGTYQSNEFHKQPYEAPSPEADNQHPLDAYLPPVENRLYFGDINISADHIGNEVRFLDEVCQTPEVDKPIEFSDGVYDIDTKVAREIADTVNKALTYEAEAEGDDASSTYYGVNWEGDQALASAGYLDGDVDIVYLDVADNDNATYVQAGDVDQSELPADGGLLTTMMLRRMVECQDKEQWVVSMGQRVGFIPGDRMYPVRDLSGFLKRFDGVSLKDPMNTPYHLQEVRPSLDNSETGQI